MALKNHSCLMPILLCAFSFFPWTRQQLTVEDAPGPLSVVHESSPGLKNCLQCHDSELDVAFSQCLACHQELAERISAARGFHRDKTEGCTGCHPEHRGRNAQLVDLDVDRFDHDETGYALLGKHRNIADCFGCHRKENSFKRSMTRSFLLNDSRCLSCHKSPHPGFQDGCQVCHGQENWQVGIWGRGLSE